MSSIPSLIQELAYAMDGRRKRRPRVDPYKLDLDNLTGDENVSVINRETGKKVKCLHGIGAVAFSSHGMDWSLCMHPVNERRRYNVTSSVIGWAPINLVW